MSTRTYTQEELDAELSQHEQAVRDEMKKLVLEVKDAPHDPLPYSYWHGHDIACEHILDALTPEPDIQETPYKHKE